MANRLIELIRMAYRYLTTRGSRTDTSDSSPPESPDPPADETDESGRQSDPSNDPADAPAETNNDDEGGENDDEQEGSNEGGQDSSKNEPANHSGDDESGIRWPPNPKVEAPHRGEGEETVEIRLFHRDGDDGGHLAARQVASHMEYCFAEAWGSDYIIDVTVVDTPVPKDIETRDEFDDYVWDLPDEERAEDANVLLFDEGGISGTGGGYVAVINALEDLRGWGYDPEDQPRAYGGGSARYATNTVIHEAGHCLGLSHDGEKTEIYGNQYVPPMITSYADGGRWVHELSPVNRRKGPTLQ